MRRLGRGLALIGLMAGVGYAVYTLTRLAKDTSADRFGDFTPTPSKPVPGPAPKPEKEPEEEKTDPGTTKPQGNQWEGVRGPKQD